MANAAVAAVNACVFTWDISDLFLRWRDYEARFYQGSPAVTQWKTTLQPAYSWSGDNWEFLFSIEFVKTLDSRPEIVADRLHVKITLDGTVVTEQVTNQSFCTDNKFKYRLWRNATIFPQTEPHHLEVLIEITLEDTTEENEGGNGLFFIEDDLRNLSRDLGLLWTGTRFCNMQLIPKLLPNSNAQEPVNTHSYIIYARWSNLFQDPDFQVQRLETNISRAVLMDIITYMYSGTVSQNWLDWNNPAYTTELLKVIDWYKLYHLYKVFVKSDLQQLRVTSFPVNTPTHLCQLNLINDRQIADDTHIWNVEGNPGLTFSFIVRNENRVGPWLSYTLQSTSKSKVYVKVIMKFLTMVNGVFETPSLFHVDDFAVDPSECESMRDRCVLFLGCPETFGRFDGAEIKYFIQCCLSINNGSTNERIRSVEDDTLLNDLERFGVLSDHMRQLRNEPAHSDMKIEIRSEGNDMKIHKGIFAIRVPDWRQGLQNVPPEDDVPGTAVSILSDDALSIVLDYVYTGKVFTLPTPEILDEIQFFAEATRFTSLLNLVNRIRLQ